jgi:hypothetical protein
MSGLEAMSKVREYAERIGGVELINAMDDFNEIIRDEELEFANEEELLEQFREFALVD